MDEDSSPEAEDLDEGEEIEEESCESGRAVWSAEDTLALLRFFADEVTRIKSTPGVNHPKGKVFFTTLTALLNKEGFCQDIPMKKVKKKLGNLRTDFKKLNKKHNRSGGIFIFQRLTFVYN